MTAPFYDRTPIEHYERPVVFLREQLEQAIDALPADPDAIAQYLADRGIRASHSKPRSVTCAMTRYLQVETGYSQISSGVMSCEAGLDRVSYPVAVQQFVVYFDKGRYDRLLVKRWWNRIATW